MMIRFLRVYAFACLSVSTAIAIYQVAKFDRATDGTVTMLFLFAMAAGIVSLISLLR
jgi:hypothetical protein